MMQELQNKFDKEQQDSQNNWQSGENKLDRDHDKEMADNSRSGGIQEVDILVIQEVITLIQEVIMVVIKTMTVEK